MELVFQGASEFVKLRIDREAKSFWIASNMTGYRFQPQPWWKLFGTTPGDVDEAKKEMEMMEPLNDEDFIRVIEATFSRNGYSLVNKKNVLSRSI